MTFELDDVLRKYSPEQFKTCEAYDVGGVNILNKKPVDSKTALDKIKRRRETHNRVERRRRDCINQLIDELTSLLPRDDDDSQSKCHRVNVLRTAVAHIQKLTQQNEDLNRQLVALQSDQPMSPPSIVTTPAPVMNHDHENKDDLHSQCTYNSETSQPHRYTAYLPHSPLSPHSPGFSPASSPRIQGQQNYEQGGSTAHLAPFSLSGSSSVDAPRSPSPSLPSLSEMSASLPSIPMIIEPSESIHPSSPTTNSSHAKRLNRQTLPRLQLVPPPFHHHRSGSNQNGAPLSPSYYGQDSLASPGSSYSGHSSASGPWSSSSSLGPFSANSSTGPLSSYGGTSPRSPGFSPYGPPSPYSPYGSATHASPTSPLAYSHPSGSIPLPRLKEWDSDREYNTFSASVNHG
ncbi:hypothetical protein BGX21_002971 [Mortierella sp. AD011]|nr:hypothetical protein BGX20_005400 [Mortierella sp. AD010]KAF9378168.1 hypothetical protein BGX21_002971 [Mortierella sp. AD011]